MLQGDIGDKIVQFSADFNTAAAILQHALDMRWISSVEKDIPKIQDAKFQQWVNDKYNIKMIVQFTFDTKGEGFKPSFCGVSIDRQSKKEDLDNNFALVFNNAPINTYTGWTPALTEYAEVKK